jgi:RNA polymerase sigma-70 factor, ECF subfamily
VPGQGRGPAVRGQVTDAGESVGRVHREEWARVVASLARRFGDLDLAEEMAAEAFAVAVERWPVDGVPPAPGAWITTTANRRAIDRLRRESRRDDKQREAQMLRDDTPAEPQGAIEDDRLRLIFTCCHPALGTEARVALTLRMVGGLTVPEIASAFLVPETTVGQRITRAKAKIKAAGIPYQVPSADDLPARVSGVLTVLFLIFNGGYLSSDPEQEAVRSDLTLEAVRLTRLLHALLPDDGEVAGLLALMLLTEARRPARVSATGELVSLDVQDRGAWDQAMISEGYALVRARLAAVAAGEARAGRFQVLAAVNAVHTSVRDIRDTDWAQVVALYDQLVRLDPSPVVALNRAVAIAERDGPQVALAVVEQLAPALAGYHAFHATRADLLRRLGRSEETRAAYEQAIALSRNRAEAAALVRRRDQLGPPV